MNCLLSFVNRLRANNQPPKHCSPAASTCAGWRQQCHGSQARTCFERSLRPLTRAALRHALPRLGCLQEAKKEVGAGVRVQYVSLNKESHVLEVPEVRSGGVVGWVVVGVEGEGLPRGQI